jgi:predicted N-acetyltransferase YhbS
MSLLFPTILRRLLDAAFGAGRFTKTSERLREGRVPARGLAFVAFDGGRLVGTVRLWSVVAGTAPRCLLLGPLAVAADIRNRGIGAALMWHALRKAKTLGHRAVLLVGDAAYYNRFGFSAEKTGALRMPGPYERDRLLACELVPGALGGARGTIAVNRPSPSRLLQYNIGLPLSLNSSFTALKPSSIPTISVLTKFLSSTVPWSSC